METENISSNPFQYNHFNSLYSELINHYYKEQPNQEILDSISTDDIRIKTDEELIRNVGNYSPDKRKNECYIKDKYQHNHAYYVDNPFDEDWEEDNYH